MARLKLQRFRASEPPDDVQARYIRVYKGRDLHYRPQALPPISAETLFGVSAPLVLDLGCGRGEFLVAQAGAQPDRYFVGFEWHIKSVWDAAHRAHAANLDNVRIVRADLRLALPIVPDGAADEVLLLFPPPKLAPNERKDDLLSEPLLRAVGAEPEFARQQPVEAAVFLLLQREEVARARAARVRGEVLEVCMGRIKASGEEVREDGCAGGFAFGAQFALAAAAALLAGERSEGDAVVIREVEGQRAGNTTLVRHQTSPS